VNGAGDEFFASARLSVDQHRGVGRGHETYDAEHTPEGGAVSDNAP
jgi:hypothetical protein